MEPSKSTQPQFEVAMPQPNRAPDDWTPRRARKLELFAPELVGPALKQAFSMLRPNIQWANPVMFVVEIGAFLTLGIVLQDAIGISGDQVPIPYFMALDIWLFLRVLFGNFATALSEAGGRAQADSLRKARRDT